MCTVFSVLSMVVDPAKFRVIQDPWLHSEFGSDLHYMKPYFKKTWHLNLYIFIILLYFISLCWKLKPGLHIC